MQPYWPSDHLSLLSSKHLLPLNTVPHTGYGTDVISNEIYPHKLPSKKNAKNTIGIILSSNKGHLCGSVG